MKTLRTLAVALMLWTLPSLGAGCGGPYLALGDDPAAGLENPDPNLVALAALAVARSGDRALQAASLDRLWALLHHRDPLVRSAASRALAEITGTPAGEYEAYRDPAEQEASIGRWRDLSERTLEAAP